MPIVEDGRIRLGVTFADSTFTLFSQIINGHSLSVQVSRETLTKWRDALTDTLDTHAAMNTTDEERGAEACHARMQRNPSYDPVFMKRIVERPDRSVPVEERLKAWLRGWDKANRMKG